MTFDKEMKREELAQNINSFEATSRKNGWPLLLILTGGAIAVIYVLPRLDSQSTLVSFLLVGSIIAPLIVPALLIERNNKKRMKEFGLYCPSCKANLVGQVGRIAVTTLYCSQCGTKIIEEEEIEQVGAGDAEEAV